MNHSLIMPKYKLDPIDPNYIWMRVKTSAYKDYCSCGKIKTKGCKLCRSCTSKRIKRTKMTDLQKAILSDLQGSFLTYSQIAKKNLTVYQYVIDVRDKYIRNKYQTIYAK